MDGGEFAALDTLKYGLARDAERAHCLAHRQEVLAGVTVEAILEIFGEAVPPRGAGCVLMGWNFGFFVLAFDSRWVYAILFSGLFFRVFLELRL
jgi:hypothetical protein